MKIEYLEEFIKVAEIGSFSKAAEELYISQSSLSKHILSLEKELKVELFDRSKKAIVLSPIGQQLLDDSKKIIFRKEMIYKIINDYDSKKRMTLTIASVPVMAQYNITGILTLFKVKYPNTILAIREHEGCDINHLLETKECELAFKRIYKSDETIEFIPIVEDCLTVVLPDDHPLSTSTAIDLRDLYDEQFMFLDHGTMLYQLSENACIEAGFTPTVTYSGHRPENIIELVKRGMGIGLLLERQATYNKISGVKCIPVEPKIVSTIFLTRLKDSTHSYSSNLFWDFVDNISKEFLNNEAN